MTSALSLRVPSSSLKLKFVGIWVSGQVNVPPFCSCSRAVLLMSFWVADGASFLVPPPPESLELLPQPARASESTVAGTSATHLLLTFTIPPSVRSERAPTPERSNVVLGGHAEITVQRRCQTTSAASA